MLRGFRFEFARTTGSHRLGDNIYMQKEFETGLATMCLERGREDSFFFPHQVHFGSCPSASGVTSKHQRGARTRRRQTPKTQRPVIIRFQSFRFSSVTSDWLIPFSALSDSPSVSPLPHGKCLPLASWPDSQIAGVVCLCQAPPCGQANVQNVRLSRECLNRVGMEWLDLVQEKLKNPK